MPRFSILKPLAFVAVIAGVAAGGYATRDHWLPLVAPPPPEETATVAPAGPATKIIVGEPAQKNLGLMSKPTRPTSYWKTLTIPAVVVDRPGVSDRGIVAPAVGVVTSIHKIPGDTVRPGDALLTLKLLSESLHQSQTELFKTTQDLKLAREQRERLAGASVPAGRLTEADGQIKRLEVAVKAYRLDLLNRGLAADKLDGIAEGQFVAELTIAAPPRPPADRPMLPSSLSAEPPAFELQELKVELGQQVQAGQTLCLLANHRLLTIEGRAFRDELPLIERSLEDGSPVEADFGDDASGWGAFAQVLHVRHIANTIDPVQRTFAVHLPLENESKVLERDGRPVVLWRFRPGQSLRLRLCVEKHDNVFVVPAEAVVREGAEAFVFTQNVNTFERKPVHVLLADHKNAVLANDGALVPGSFVAQSAAAQLNRMVKAGSGGVPKGYHMHADGSLHKNDDEGK